MKTSTHSPFVIAESLIYAYLAAELENKSPSEIASRWPRVLEVLRVALVFDDPHALDTLLSPILDD